MRETINKNGIRRIGDYEAEKAFLQSESGGLPTRSASAFTVLFDGPALLGGVMRVLLVYKFNELRSWGLPGGGVEAYDQTIEAGLFREVYQETGYTLPHSELDGLVLDTTELFS